MWRKMAEMRMTPLEREKSWRMMQMGGHSSQLWDIKALKNAKESLGYMSRLTIVSPIHIGVEAKHSLQVDAGHYCENPKAQVRWGDIAHNPDTYTFAQEHPEGITLKYPSHLHHEDIKVCWNFWYLRWRSVSAYSHDGRVTRVDSYTVLHNACFGAS